MSVSDEVLKKLLTDIASSSSTVQAFDAAERLFRLFDTNSSGNISKSELKSVESAGVLSAEQLAAFSAFDANADERISWPEFLAWYAATFAGVSVKEKTHRRKKRRHQSSRDAPAAAAAAADPVAQLAKDLAAFKCVGDTNLSACFEMFDLADGVFDRLAAGVASASSNAVTVRIAADADVPESLERPRGPHEIVVVEKAAEKKKQLVVLASGSPYVKFV